MLLNSITLFMLRNCLKSEVRLNINLFKCAKSRWSVFEFPNEPTLNLNFHTLIQSTLDI